MKLAIHGGKPIRTKMFPSFNSIGDQEKKAVNRVMDSGVLSEFKASYGEQFFGGTEVKALEYEWAQYFGTRNAIAVNSATSGLYAAVGATDIEPGDEIIVTPYSMSASANAPLIFNSIPVFSDIEEEYFCLDSNFIEKNITSRTKAIIIVDIFGQPYDADRINSIAKKYDIIVIEDAAQAPFSFFKGKPTGTLGDIGVFSLNRHKHIQCGEGGIIVTNNDELADKMRMIRNHAETVITEENSSNIVNMIGYNFRMTELESAVARCQLKKLKELVEKRQENCEYLKFRLKEIPPIYETRIRKNSTHSYYVLPFKFKEKNSNVSRDIFINAVKAELPLTEGREDEGVRIVCGYYKPLHLLPMFQSKIAYGSLGFPWTISSRDISYQKGICPIAERMYESELFFIDIMHPGVSKKDMDDVIDAFTKVWENIELL